jgi:hypothetical protein
MHYILVVHGTWNAPDRNVRMWYQLDPADPANFCQRLKQRLEANGLSGTVWPSPDGQLIDFVWSGENTHDARCAAGDRLAQVMREIASKDPDARIHLVGHSHGGNVVLRAVREVWGGSASRPATITLLGTPFYRKVWQRNKVVDTLRRLPSAIVTALVIAIPFLYPLVMLSSALLALLPTVAMISWNPLGWPAWLKLVIVLVIVGLGWLLDWISALVEIQDTNIYFDESALIEKTPQAPIPALVVSAGRFDEAFLALSAEPLAVAFLVPQLRAILGRSRRPLFDDWDQAGRIPTFRVPGQIINDVITRGAWNVGYMLLSPLWVPLRDHVIHPLLSRVMLRAVNATAFGLPPSELAGARIEISDRLALPTRFEETHLDVADVLLHAPPRPPTATLPDDAAARYDFLHVEERLEEKKSSSTLWKTVSAAMPDLRKRYRGNEPARLEHDLLLHSLMLEERLKEVAGSVPLAHSGYYSNEEVIETIARFVAARASKDTEHQERAKA